MRAFGTQQGIPGQTIPGNTAGVFPDAVGNLPGQTPEGSVNIGGNTVSEEGASPVDVASAQTLSGMLIQLQKLVKRLAPSKVREPFRFMNMASGSDPVVITMGGVTFNGFDYAILSGTALIYFGESVDTDNAGNPINPPDIIFVGGTSSGYHPLPADMDLVITIFSADPNNVLTGTITAVQF